jgi:hypothetical protein
MTTEQQLTSLYQRRTALQQDLARHTAGLALLQARIRAVQAARERETSALLQAIARWSHATGGEARGDAPPSRVRRPAAILPSRP